jgi:3-hydroxyacyl-CoA dehydrogenase
MQVIKTVSVIGATTIGRAIAQAVLLAGYRTILEDFSLQNIDAALASMKSAVPEQAIRKLRCTTSIEDALREADLVIEAAAEEMEAKIELFTIFDKFAKPNAILASSSASLSIEDMASVTFCSERCIGIRFPGPHVITSPIELVPTVQTSVVVVDTCREFARHLGKQATVMQQSDAASAGNTN